MVVRDYKQDSILLNTVTYKAAAALGLVVPPEDYHGELGPEELIDRLIARATGVKVPLMGG